MKIFFKGQAGQGIKLLSHSLANALMQLDYEVSVYVNYGASVSSGEIFSELIFDKQTVKVPFIENPDIEVLFEKSGEDKVNIKQGGKTESHNIGWLSVEKLKNKRSENMIVFGRILKILKIKIDKINFKEMLPEKFFDVNIKAIKLGYEVKP